MMFAAVIVVVCLLCYLWNSTGKPKNFPPGPPWKPIVGSYQIFRETTKKFGLQHLALTALSKQWNTQILGLKLGDDLVVSVEDFPTIKKMMCGEEYDQRPINYFSKLRALGTCKGITFAEGKSCAENRKFVISYLRQIGKGRLGEKINEELEKLIVEIDTRQQTEEIGKLLPYAIINSLWCFVAGRRVDRGTFEQNQLLNLIRERTKAFDVSLGALSKYPWLRFIIPEKSGYNLIKRFNAEIKAFLMQTIDDHYSTWTVGNNTDFIYNYFDQIRKGSSSSTFTDEELFSVCLDLFMGGFSTVTYTLDFFFLMMILHQNVQSKIQKLLDAAFDENDPIEYKDRLKVPYVEAAIKEIQRFVPIVPIMGPRRTTRVTTLNGYTLPKNTTVLMNLYPTFMSEEIWGDPHTFIPERFLNEHGELISVPELIPFGLGRRRCVGDIFAQQCIFIFISRLLRIYKVLPANANDLPTVTIQPGVLMSPKPYHVKFVRRC